jgi:hypothetical protein
MSFPLALILFALLMSGLIAWQICTGKVLSRSWKIWTTRDDDPVLYWLVVGAQTLIFVVFLLLALSLYFKSLGK